MDHTVSSVMGRGVRGEDASTREYTRLSSTLEVQLRPGHFWLFVPLDGKERKVNSYQRLWTLISRRSSITASRREKEGAFRVRDVGCLLGLLTW